MKTIDWMKLKWCRPFLYLILLTLLADARFAAGQGLPISQYPLNSWSFYDTNTWASDDGYAPVSFTNVNASLFGDGTALVLDSTNAAWLQYNVYENDGATNLTVNQGSVTLWFAPSWGSTNAGGSGPGGRGQLVDAGQWTSNATYGWWSLFTDPAGANLYFSAQNNSGTETNYLSAPIAWTPNQWHFIALTYSSTNTALYLDGQPATNGVGMSIWPAANVLSNGFYIGSDTNGLTQAHGKFDDIYTYNYVLDSNAISSTFSLFNGNYYLLDSWSFSDTTNWTSDFGYAPVAFTNLNSSLLGDGSALLLDSTNVAFLQYNIIENDGTTNLTVDRGSVMFWFAPTWAGTNQGGSGPGQWGRLIEAGTYTTNASYGWWSLYVDPEGANIYFAAQTNNGSQDIYLSAPIEWTTNRWHMLVLTYSATNSAIYVDGTLATNGSSVTYWPGADVLTNGFYIGSDSNGIAQARGMFDDLSTYNYPLDAATISDAFNFFEGYYYLNPENIGNDSSILSAPSTPSYTPSYDVITGQGDLLWVTNASSCSYGTNAYNIWITNVVATMTGSGTNATMNIKFTIEGGADNVPYDVFANSMLGFGTNSMPWAWMGQAYHCKTYMLTNLQITACFLILGTPQDSSGFGLTDAYELLVLEINPDGSQTDSYGVPYAWYAENGLTSLTAGLGGQDPDLDGLLNYQEYLYGTKPLVSEGFAVWVSQLNGTSSIP